MKLQRLGYGAFAIAAGFVVAAGSAAPSYAKGKKAAEDPGMYWMVCTFDTGAVCGSWKGMKLTYANACSAVKDGAKIVKNKPCK